MSFLSKVIKKNKKGAVRLLKKNKKALLNVGRVGAAVLTRGKSEKVIGTLKGIGSGLAVVKKIRGGAAKLATKAEKAVAAKVHIASAPKVIPQSSTRAETMPGGAPLPGVRQSNNVRAGVVAAGKRTSKRRAGKRAAKPKTVQQTIRSGRRAPTGGLDLKGLSASWKAAGKPGTWQGWIQSHK